MTALLIYVWLSRFVEYFHGCHPPCMFWLMCSVVRSLCVDIAFVTSLFELLMCLLSGFVVRYFRNHDGRDCVEVFFHRQNVLCFAQPVKVFAICSRARCATTAHHLMNNYLMLAS